MCVCVCVCYTKLKHFPSSPGDTGHYYCGMKVLTCVCCDGHCGPTNGCNCPPCQRLDREDANLQQMESVQPKPSTPLIESWTWGQQPGQFCVAVSFLFSLIPLFLFFFSFCLSVSVLYVCFSLCLSIFICLSICLIIYFILSFPQSFPLSPFHYVCVSLTAFNFYM